MIFITQRYKISVIASSSAEHFNGFIRREAVRGGRFRLFSGGYICECYFNSLYLYGKANLKQRESEKIFEMGLCRDVRIGRGDMCGKRCSGVVWR